MKLSEYISDKLHKTWPIEGIPAEEDIEKWIVEWYKIAFRKSPPMWMTARQAMPSRFAKRKE